MLSSNKKIVIPGEKALEALAEIEFILVSLRKIETYYIDRTVEDYRRATTDFVDDFKVTQRLAKVRRIICEHVDSTLGEDDMDDVERHVKNLAYWKPEQ